MKYITGLVCLLLLPLLVLSQQIERKQLSASFTDADIVLDGILDESAWAIAPEAKGFTENAPKPFDAPLQPSTVKVLYDDLGIYIGAMLYDTAPDSILKELSPRDDIRNTDFFGVVIDPYLDGINGLGFLVTAAGVQIDQKYTIDGEDATWDAVWWSRVNIHDSGWTVEMLLPYPALRFSDKAGDTWGLNFQRYIRRTRESSFWNTVDPNIQGLVNQSGRLSGLKNIKAPIRLSLFPYVSSYLDLINRPNSQTLTNSYNAGLDLKYGINDAFTLDMTLIPDFGQVIFDDQVLNLGPFEVQFNENRQFFTEGTELFTKGEVFYSRRIGDRPLHYGRVESQLQPGERILANPRESQLINATKITGRNSNKLGIAFFNAVEAETYATLETATGEQREIQTNPLTNYNMFVLDQALKNNSYVTLYNTNVLRNGGDYDANITGTQFEFRDKDNAYYVSGNLTVSQLYAGALADTDLGYRYYLELGKKRGKLQYNFSYYVETDRYNPNDFGFLLANNERVSALTIRYNEFTPFGWINSIRNNLTLYYSRLQNPDNFTTTGLSFTNFITFTNFLTISLDAGTQPWGENDFFEPRAPGRFFHRPGSYYVGGFFSPDYRKAFIVDGRFYYTHYSRWNWANYFYRLAPRWRVNDRLSFRYSLEYNLGQNEVGYTTSTDSEIIFGQRKVRTWENFLEGTVIFNPLMNISLRARHYWSQAAYSAFFALQDDGSLGNAQYDGLNNDGTSERDINFNAWTIDLGYTWQFAPGSNMSIVWKNAIFQEGQQLPSTYGENWQVMWDNPQSYSLSIRLIYFLDYLTIQQSNLPRKVTG